jgi:hypothetical protein
VREAWLEGESAMGMSDAFADQIRIRILDDYEYTTLYQSEIRARAGTKFRNVLAPHLLRYTSSAMCPPNLECGYN